MNQVTWDNPKWNTTQVTWDGGSITARMEYNNRSTRNNRGRHLSQEERRSAAIGERRPVGAPERDRRLLHADPIFFFFEIPL